MHEWLHKMSTGRAEVISFGLFDKQETELVEAAFADLQATRPQDAHTLRGLLTRLAHLCDILNAERMLREPTQLGGEVRTEKSLIDHLCQLDGLSGDLVVPLKGTLSRSFLLAKIMFLRAFIKSTKALAGKDPVFGEYTHQLCEELAQSIYTLLAEELLLAILRKPGISQHIKRTSADQLISIWDNAQLEIDDFCPLLESAWHARNSVSSGMGCLLGTTEYFRLVSEDCAPQFLDFFARDEVSVPERQAFEEFLFNMTYEELSLLRRSMQEQGIDAVDANWCSNVLGRQIEKLDTAGEIDPMALYRSYYRRQLAADARIISGGDGPRRTAEGYMMLYILSQ